MKVTVVHPDELERAEAVRWASFQQRTVNGANPLLSLGFARAVGAVRRNARVAVAEEDGKIEMFLPFELGPNGVARPIGWRVSILQGIVGSGAPIDLRRVVQAAGLRGWRFDHVDAGDPLLQPYHYAGPATPVPVIDLREGFTAYLETRTNQLRRENRRRIRNLEREIGAVSFEWQASHETHLPLLIEWKSAQYDTARSLYADPGPRLVIERLLAAASDGCHARLSVLSAGGLPIALHLGVLDGGVLLSYEIAYDHRLAGFAPGFMLWLALIERAAREGITRIDLGYGAPSHHGRRNYKLELANDSYEVLGGAVWATRLEASARALYRRIRCA